MCVTCNVMKNPLNINNINFRKIRVGEYEFLNEMLYEAIFVPENIQKPSKGIIKLPELSKYTDNWNKNIYDVAIVALYNKKLIGAIWGRIFGSNNKGYGYVAEDIPEISMAILKNYRGNGIGTELIKRIIFEYRKLNVEKISLSVSTQNKAKKLYEKSGFKKVGDEESDNITMILEL